MSHYNFNCPDESNITIEMITTSEIRITCVIKEKDVKKAGSSLHEKFQLDKD